MKRNNRIETMVVCLDLTEIDRELIDYARFIGRHLQTREIFLLHVIQAYDLSGRREDELAQVKKTLEQKLNEQIRRLPAEGSPLHCAVEIEKEDASKRIIAFADTHGADLVVLGKKYGSDRDARYGERIAAGTSADLLFVPQQPNPSAARVLCALDFSPHAEEAFARALHFRKTAGSQLSCYYLYDASASYFPAATFRASASLEQKLQKNARSFFQQFGLDPEEIPCTISLDDPTETHVRKISREPADLIILGAKGAVGSVTTPLGNAAESLRRSQLHTPVMVMKNRRG